MAGGYKSGSAARSNTNHPSALYAPYVPAFRPASDWVQQSDVPDYAPPRPLTAMATARAARSG